MPLLTERFEPDFRSVGSARRAALRALQVPGLTWLQDDVGTVVSELATNAVLHARSGFMVVLAVGRERLRVSVVDESPVLPRLRRFGDAGSTTGRGLQMVAALSTDWGVARPAGTGGKETWCEFALTPTDGDGHDRSRRHPDPGVVPDPGVAPGPGVGGDVDVAALLAGFDEGPEPPRCGATGRARAAPGSAGRRAVLV